MKSTRLGRLALRHGRRPGTQIEPRASEAEILLHYSDGSIVPRRIVRLLGSSHRVTFSASDELGQEILRRWRLPIDLAPAAAAREWPMLGALAWVASKNLETVARACRGLSLLPEDAAAEPMALRDRHGRDEQYIHELAVLQHHIHGPFCDCARTDDWEKCPALQSAADELRDRIRRGQLEAIGYYSGNKVKSPNPIDFRGIALAAGMPKLLYFNALAAIRFPAAVLSEVYLRDPRLATPDEIKDWMRRWAAANESLNSKKAIAAYRADLTMPTLKSDAFMSYWKDATGHRNRGRMPKRADQWPR